MKPYTRNRYPVRARSRASTTTSQSSPVFSLRKTMVATQDNEVRLARVVIMPQAVRHASSLAETRRVVYAASRPRYAPKSGSVWSLHSGRIPGPPASLCHQVRSVVHVVHRPRGRALLNSPPERVVAERNHPARARQGYRSQAVLVIPAVAGGPVAVRLLVIFPL